jgi:hypothetical protein
MKNTIFLLFICSQTYAQTINFKGKLLDKETNKPVVYANISFLKTNIGISSLEDGSFNLEIDKKILQEKVHISCLNYKDTIVLAQSLFQKTLFLQPKSFELKEVVISKKVDRELEVDTYKRRDIKATFGGRQSNPWTVAKFFKYREEYKETPYIKDLSVYFGAMIVREKSKFRVRLFKIDTITGFPSEDLVHKEIIAYSKLLNGKVKIDVSKYDIEFPKEGFFVGLERLHIPNNFYEYKYTMQGSKKKYTAKAVAPSFGAVYTKDSTFHFSSGKWKKFYYPHKDYEGNQIQPAISLTLSN